ncbi:MAG: hypothetical protein KatS3mg110_4628 [Pirellulaceae bacterium]|nr:MAG: hypothetical protein KatS3mg110_4628 [Pirellulaceae bacterium]
MMGEKNRSEDPGPDDQAILARLLEYSFGELSEAERAEIERRIQDDPAWRAQWGELQRLFELLWVGEQVYEPPGDLVERTLAQIEQPARAGNLCFVSSSTRWLDVVCGMAVCLVLALIFFPAVVNSRELARRTFCQENLRQLGIALETYIEHFHCLPWIPERGQLAFAGYVPVVLRHAQYLTEDSRVLCPGVPASGQPFSIPPPAELLAARGTRLAHLQRMAGGHFAYNLGVIDGGRYRAAWREGRTWFAWVSDAPLVPDRIPPIHGGRGFNVLFEDGHIQYVCSCRAPGTQDHLLRNYLGLVAAGMVKDDVVLGRSEATPFPDAAR